MLGLPGSSYLYEGEELGLEQVDVAPEFRQDPSWFRTGEIGRDGCRVPIPWGDESPPYAFGPGLDQPWIPQPDDWALLTVKAQESDPDSTLSFYQAALTARRGLVDAGDTIEMLDLGSDVLAFRRGEFTVVLNCGPAPVGLPAGEVLIASGPLSDGATPGRHGGLARLSQRPSSPAVVRCS